MIFLNCDITEINADIIVNASNGIGFMGGYFSRYVKFKGIAEAINYKTKGIVEKQAIQLCKRNKYKAGDIFVTDAENLNSKYIVHAVTMKYPGTFSKYEIIQKLLPKIISKAYELNVKSLAIPLLGTGTGNISKDKIINLYKNVFNDINDLDIIIVYK